MMSFSWLPELLAMCGSLLCLAALILVLRIYDGHEIFLWHRITLNTIVSVLTTTSKIGLLFALAETTSQWIWILFRSPRPATHLIAIDRGSRGPFGSLQLIWSVNKATVLRAGTLATILAIAIDPFAQQLVQLSQKTSYTSSLNATIPRADRYSKGHDVRKTGGSSSDYNLTLSKHPDIVSSTIDYSLQSAIVSGLTRPAESVTQQLLWSCPSGNCTWEPFDSLAVCSVCNSLNTSLFRYDDKGDLGTHLATNRGSSFTSFDNSGTAFRLPNGHYITNIDGWAFNHRKNETVAETATGGVVYMSTFGTPYASWTNSFRGLPNLIWAMSMIRVLPSQSDPSATWPNLPIEATECALTYCVNQYRSSVINGSLVEAVSYNLSGYERDPKSWQVDTRGWGTMNKSDADSLAFSPYFSYFPRTDLRLGDKFNISQSAVNSISSFFRGTFAADLSAQKYYINYTYSNGWPMLNGFYMDNGDTQWAPGVMEALYSSKDLGSTFTAIARSMSNSLREGNDGAVTWAGQSGNQIIFYDIEWPWISLHCLVTLIGLVFLIMTMMRSKRLNAPMYGSSIPAIIPEGGLVKAVQAPDIREQILVMPDQGATAQGIPLVRVRGAGEVEDGLLQGQHA